MKIFTVLHMFCGLGGGALGFQAAEASWRGNRGRFKTVGGIDNNKEAVEDFRQLTGAPAWVADIATLGDQELRAMVPEPPDVVFMSPPCKGFSSLLAARTARTEKYQAMNRLVVQSIFLAAKTWATPPKLILLENVPRITSRGAGLLLEVTHLLSTLGYKVKMSSHDCGELGNLAQHRKRFLLLARHEPQLPTFVYNPSKKPVRAIGSVLGKLPMPDDPSAGKIHELPRLQWLTWVRLALIPAGGDWRDLEQYGGKGCFGNIMRVIPWDGTSGTVVGAGRPGSGAISVADPRSVQPFNNVWRVVGWEEPAGAVTSGHGPSSSGTCVGDPRLSHEPRRGAFKLVAYDEPAPTVIGGAGVGRSCSFAVQDPRLGYMPARHHKFKVSGWEAAGNCITGADRVGSGAPSVADPRLGCAPRRGTYGVLSYDQPSGTVAGSADVHSGSSAVADPRIPGDSDCPDPPPVIIALDETWHRPLTTLELAALQGLPTHMRDGSPLTLVGDAHNRWRERIGNAVPPPAARAVAEALLRSLIPATYGRLAFGRHGVWVEEEERAES